MRNSHRGTLRRQGFSIVAFVALTQGASAAPKAGPPFTLAEAQAADVRYSIAGNARGYLLSWSEGGAVRAQGLGADASRLGPPESVATPDTTGPDTKEYVGTRVVANATDYLLQYGFRSTGVPSGQLTPVLVETGFELKAFSQSGGIAPARTPGMLLPVWKAGVTSGAGNTFSLLELTFEPASGRPIFLGLKTSKGSAPGTESGSVTGGILTTELLDMASNGTKTLATVRTEMGAALVRFGEGTLTETPGASAARTMLVASHEDLFVLVSQSDAGLLSFVLTGGDIPGRSSPSVIHNAQGTGPETLLAIEPADESCLVLSAAGGDGGSVLRVRRLTYDGRVLDPAGVDVAEGSEGDLARSHGDHWLLATHEMVNDKELIRGRFIGEGELPPPPVDVPDAGVPSGPDAAVATSGTGGRSSSPGGTGGRQSSSGGASGAAAGGTEADASDSSGGSPSRAAGSDDSGCAVKPSPRGAGSTFALLIVAGAACAARRRLSRR
jgi:hypothetical protein